MKILTWLLLLVPFLAAAQQVDTLTITKEDAEKKFLSGNLLLLASQYHIGEQQALVSQARLFNNPGMHLEQGLYNPGNHRVLEQAPNGQNLVIFTQLFELAGKRNKRIQMATINTQVARYQFEDLLRTLRFTLVSNLNDLYYLQQTQTFYVRELGNLLQILDGFSTQYQKGNIALKELVRMQSLVFSLKAEKNNLDLEISDRERGLNILLASAKPTYYKVASIPENNIVFTSVNLTGLIDTARTFRPDVLIQACGVQYAGFDLAYQRSLVVPDLSIGFLADRHSNYIQNYTGLNIDMTLPLWNQNQGNIKAAKYRVNQSQALYNQSLQQVASEMTDVYTSLVSVNRIYTDYSGSFTTDLEKLMDGVEDNFANRNISIVEFMDFYESYKNSMIQLNQLANKRQNTIEELNYTVGKKVL